VRVQDAVLVLMSVLFRRAGLGDDFYASVPNAAGGEDSIGDRLELVCATAHHDDLETEIVTQVNVEGRSHAITEVVLELRELLAQIADVVVIDDRQGRDGFRAGPDLGLHYLCSGQVAEELGTRALARTNEGVELF
jgi:hypothetical protein